MSPKISLEIRKHVWQRANGCCEYCGIHEEDSFYRHEIDHILPIKHGGNTVPNNLALSCFYCNRYKGANIASIDSVTGKIELLFNPRKQKWEEHFMLIENEFAHLTPTGKVTIIVTIQPVECPLSTRLSFRF